MAGPSRRTAVISAAVVAALVAGGGLWFVRSRASSDPVTGPAALSTVTVGERDPRPAGTFPTSVTVDAAGKRVGNDYVTADVPAGAVAGDDRVTVSLGTPLGRTTGPGTIESRGAPVRVDHTAPLAGPVILTWRLDGLTAEQRMSIVLVRWDPVRQLWATTDEPVTLGEHTLSVRVGSPRATRRPCRRRSRTAGSPTRSRPGCGTWTSGS
jgi:hypothetical protein